MSNETVIQNKQVIDHAPALWRDAVSDSQALVLLHAANPAVGLPVPHFKKTAPCEFVRCVRLQAGTETRPWFLPSSVSENQFNKGSSGFLCGIGQPRRVGVRNRQPRRMGDSEDNPAGWATAKPTLLS